MRSPLTLGIVFLALAAFSVAGIPGGHLGPSGYAVVGLLGAAGALVMLGLRAGYYLGLVAGGVTAVTGLLGWAGIGGGRLGLPVHPGLSVVAGLYLCFRVALAHKMFFKSAPRELPRPSLPRAEESD